MNLHAYKTRAAAWQADPGPRGLRPDPYLSCRPEDRRSRAAAEIRQGIAALLSRYAAEQATEEDLSKLGGLTRVAGRLDSLPPGDAWTAGGLPKTASFPKRRHDGDNGLVSEHFVPNKVLN